jgi:phage major head subunit gpT-like protein
MIINQATLANIYVAFSTAFNAAFQEAVVWYEKIAMTVPSAGRSLDYKFLLDFPQVREWIGERVMRSLEGKAMQVVNKDYESTIEVARNDIEDDQIGLYAPLVSQLAFEARKHPDYLCAGLLKDGLVNKAYDGKAFFAADHKVGKTSVGNLDAAASTPWYLLDTSRPVKPFVFQLRQAVQLLRMDLPTDDHVFMRKMFRYGVDYRGAAAYGLWQLAYCSTQTLTAEHYGNARAAMMAFKNADGRPLGINPTLMVVPPSLEGAARQILNAQFIIGEGATSSAVQSNVWQGTAQLLVVPELA